MENYTFVTVVDFKEMPMKKTLLPFTFLFSVALVACQQPGLPTPEASSDAEMATTSTVLPEESGNLQAQALPAWPALKAGSTGADVEALQYLLRAKGATLTVDGDFGPATTSAVRAFQSRSGVGVSGIVGAQTWEALVPILRNGSTGEAVKAVQMYLGVTVDGAFGPGTESAVKAFQSRTDVGVSGVVGPQTWQALVGSSSTVSTSRAALARQILSNSRITLSRSGHTIGASPYQTVVDTAAGKMAKRGCSGNANCGKYTYLSPSMLAGMLKVAASYTFQVNSTTGSGKHSATSFHYVGQAFDVNVINGRGVSASNPYYRAFMQACRNAGADEVLGPGDDHHSTHIHCGWK